MGEISKMILSGDLDSITGEYLGNGYGIPRSLNEGKMKCRNSINRYGYPTSEWRRMNKESKVVIKILYNKGYHNLESRQDIMNRYFHECLGWKRLSKNNKKYKYIYTDINKFINFINGLKDD